MRVKFLSNGAEVELPDDAAAWLQANYESLIEEVKAVPPAHGTVEKATADLKAYRDRQFVK